MRSLSFLTINSRRHRGFTLVELMIVVAIIGVLATIAIVSYTEWVKRAKMQELESYVLEVENAQQSYHSRNHEYFDVEDVTGSTEYDRDDEYWTQVLEFSAQVPEGVVIHTDAGDNCGICQNAADPSSNNDVWYVVRGEHEDLDYDVFTSSAHDRPFEVAPMNP